MSINYSPELVRARMQERILEAQTARLGKEIEDAQGAPAGSLVSRLSRLLARRSAVPITAACTTC